jgi:protein-disulfide isomerase
MSSLSRLISAAVGLLVPDAPTITDVYADIPQSRSEDGAFTLGDPDAPVTIIEFLDFGCPHCQAYKPTIDSFIEQYVATGQARYEVRLFPTAGGALTDLAGRLAECADDTRPGAFWSAYDTLYTLGMNGKYNDKLGQAMANELGLEYASLLECAQTAEQITTDVEYGRTLGVTGTPAILVRFGDDDATSITLDGQTYDRGGVPLDVLAQVVEQANE